jgi:hypothetical protein
VATLITGSGVDKVIDGSITSTKIADGTILNADINDVAASKLTGALPVISGASLTGLKAGSSYFQARFSTSAWSAKSAFAKLGFDATWTNVGSDFDTTDNRYIAPETGVYSFYFSIYTAQADSSNGFQWRKNGSPNSIQDYESTFCAYNEEGTGDKILSASLVVQLNATEYVEVFTATTSDVYTGHSCFGGFRLA